MKIFDEQKIVTMAPNANAVSNGRKISASGGFVRRIKSEDDSFYAGECKGSGKKNYIVSVDLVDRNNPVFRCSCPSRQFPCKHSIALMFEMVADKAFDIEDIPQDILDKRSKKEAREQKKAEKAEKPKKVTAQSKAARTKKIKKQLEGLDLLRDLMARITDVGIAATASTPLKENQALAKQLGDYYLPGVQVIFNRFLYAMEKVQREKETNYSDAVDELVKLRYIEKRARVYLEKKLESDQPEADDNLLYEALGGVWKLDELNALGLKKEKVSLVQLSFSVENDPVKREFADIGYWIDLEDGQINYTANYCPEKAKKYIHREDSFFDVKEIETLLFYPAMEGENKRIRWDKDGERKISAEDIQKIRGFAAKGISDWIKPAKNVLKATLSDNAYAVLFHYSKIGLNTEGEFVAEDEDKKQIILKNKQGKTDVFGFLPVDDVEHNQVLFGIAYYDQENRRICVEPRSVITQDSVVRLAY